MTRPKLFLFLGFFFVTWFCAATTSHFIGREFIRAHDNPELRPLSDDQMGRGQGLLFLNFPLVIGMGIMMRSAAPVNPFAYWSLVTLGCVYLPIIVTIILFFLTHAPGTVHSWPGVDIDDGSLKDEDDDD